jgi:hypothetical protein
MRVNKIFFFLLLCSIQYACEDDKNSSEIKSTIYKLYQLENAGWKSKSVTHYINDIQYKATEVPIEYYLLKDQGANNLTRVDSLTKKLNRERVVEVEFEHIKNKDLLKEEFTRLDYNKSVMYLASTISKDFKAVTSKNDTIECAGVHFERNFKVAPYKKVILFFGDIEPNETIQLIYEDRLFNNGIFKFKFNEVPFKT